MKIKDIIQYVNSDYLLVSDESSEYMVEYLKKNELSDTVLNAQLSRLEPVIAIKKTVFDENASDSDFVSALKIVTGGQTVRETVEETVEEDVYEEAPHYHEPRRKRPRPESTEQQGQSPFNPLGFDPSLISSLLTPEMMSRITESDLFKEMMKPENIKRTLESDEFKSFMQNSDMGSLFGGVPPIFHRDHNEEEYEEYEEYEDVDDAPDDDDDEYEEL